MKAEPEITEPGITADGAAEWLKSGDSLRLDHQLCFALYTASNMMTRVYRPLLQPLGLTYLQYLAMLTLWEQSPQGVGEMGRKLGLDSGTLTPLFKRMEVAGLVTRTRDPVDERRVEIGLTDAGRALKTRAADIPAAVLCRTSMSLREAAQLKISVERLMTGLRAEAEADGESRSET